jgi:hypothetical protein
MKNVYINISDVASYIGQNKWDFVTPFERLWEKCDKEGYNALINPFKEEQKEGLDKIETINEELNILNKSLQTCSEEKKVEIKKDIITKNEVIVSLQEKVTKTNEIIDNNTKGDDKIKNLIDKEVLKKINDSDMKIEEKKNMLQEEIKKININEDNKKSLLLDGNSFINKTHGTKKEDSAIELFEKKIGVKLNTSQKYYSYLITKTNNYNWFIGGKMDGIYEDEKTPYIVEIKNRVKGFFNRLRDYEQTQIQLYMKISDIPYAKLVERYNNSIRITDIYEDALYINDTIELTKNFINLFEKFLENKSDQVEFIFLDKEHKKRWIYNNFFNKLEDSFIDTESCKI